MEKTNHIGDIARQLNISQRTVRYYEELGLIAADRSTGGFRLFSDPQVEKLKTILALKEIGMPLDEIKHFLHLRQHGIAGSEAASELLSYLKTKVGELKKTIKKYNSLLKELEEVIDITENCKECNKVTEESSCERCVDTRTHNHTPPLMKSLL